MASAAKKESVRRMTPLAVLKDLVKLGVACADRAQRAAGQFGQAVKDAAEHKHLNPKAFKMAMSLLKVGEKDPVKLAFLLEDFDHYRELLKIDDMAATKLPGLDEEEPSNIAAQNGHAKNGKGKTKKHGVSAAKSDAAVAAAIKGGDSKVAKLF